MKGDQGKQSQTHRESAERESNQWKTKGGRSKTKATGTQINAASMLALGGFCSRLSACRFLWCKIAFGFADAPDKGILDCARRGDPDGVKVDVHVRPARRAEHPRGPKRCKGKARGRPARRADGPRSRKRRKGKARGRPARRAERPRGPKQCKGKARGGPVRRA